MRFIKTELQGARAFCQKEFAQHGLRPVIAQAKQRAAGVTV